MADFFERIKQSIEKGITFASVKSKELLEATKLKTHIQTLQEQKRITLEELGNIVYIMFIKEVSDENRIRKKCEAIRELDSQIKENEEELRQVHLKAQEALGKPKTIAVCDCGAEIYKGAKFCRKCGKKIEEIGNKDKIEEIGNKDKVEEEVMSEKVCPHCGAQLLSKDKFCTNCGQLC